LLNFFGKIRFGESGVINVGDTQKAQEDVKKKKLADCKGSQWNPPAAATVIDWPFWMKEIVIDN